MPNVNLVNMVVVNVFLFSTTVLPVLPDLFYTTILVSKTVETDSILSTPITSRPLVVSVTIIVPPVSNSHQISVKNVTPDSS